MPRGRTATSSPLHARNVSLQFSPVVQRSLQAQWSWPTVWSKVCANICSSSCKVLWKLFSGGGSKAVENGWHFGFPLELKIDVGLFFLSSRTCSCGRPLKVAALCYRCLLSSDQSLEENYFEVVVSSETVGENFLDRTACVVPRAGTRRLPDPDSHRKSLHCCTLQIGGSRAVRKFHCCCRSTSFIKFRR